MTNVDHTHTQAWSDGSCLILIPAGPAILGTNDEQTLRRVDEDTPWYDIRRIEPPRVLADVPAFLVGKFPVTCAQYATFLNQVGATLVSGYAEIDSNVAAADVRSWLSERDPREAPHGVGVYFGIEFGWAPAPGCDDLPVTLVTWFGARAYATHHSARLPGEVEWEKAARGEQGLRFPWGDEYVLGNANLSDHWAGYRIQTQAQWDTDFWQGGTGSGWLASTPNAPGAFPRGLSLYGIEDMIGNVAEWCEDVYDASSEGGRMDFRAMRGAGRYGYSAIARCATRRRRAPESVSENLGFRIVVDAITHGLAA